MTSFREYRERMAMGQPPEVEEITVPKEVRPFQGMRAGIVSRTVANSIDFGIIAITLLVLYAGWAALQFLLNPVAFSWPSLPWGAVLAIGFGLMFVYFAVSWLWTGRTYGDHLMGLRVVNFRGDRMRFSGAVVRSLFCVGVPIGLFWVVISRENRSIQDVVLRTNVIYDWQVTVHRAPAAQEHAAAAGSPSADVEAMRPDAGS